MEKHNGFKFTVADYGSLSTSHSKVDQLLTLAALLCGTIRRAETMRIFKSITQHIHVRERTITKIMTTDSRCLGLWRAFYVEFEWKVVGAFYEGWTTLFGSDG
jgi:hypothetical protein